MSVVECRHSLGHCPCCVEYVDGPVNAFLVGTYELVEQSDPRHEALETVNYRLGNLVLFDPHTRQDICQFECQDGGVFHFKTFKMERDCDPVVWIYSAHSNGHISLHQISSAGKSISFLTSYSTGLGLLTHLDIYCARDNEPIDLLVSSDRGTVMSIRHAPETSQELEDTSFQQVFQIQANKCGDPIWVVHLIDGPIQDERILLVGGDDCQWRAYSYTSLLSTSSLGSPSSHKPLIINRDCESGVTCFSVLPEDSHDETGIKLIYLLVGSYDERIRLYRLGTESVGASDRWTTELMLVTHIPGAGIWRMKWLQVSPTEQILLVAAMYAGAHYISGLSPLSPQDKDHDPPKVHHIPLADKQDESESHPSASDATKSELIYDISHSPKSLVPEDSCEDFSRLVAVSFYRKQIIFCKGIPNI